MGPGTSYADRKKAPKASGFFENLGLSQEKRDARRKAREERRKGTATAKPAKSLGTPEASRVDYAQRKPEPATTVSKVTRKTTPAMAAGAPFPRPSAKSPSSAGPVVERAKVAAAKAPKARARPAVTVSSSGPPKARPKAAKPGLMERVGKALAGNRGNQQKLALERMKKSGRKG